MIPACIEPEIEWVVCIIRRETVFRDRVGHRLLAIRMVGQAELAPIWPCQHPPTSRSHVQVSGILMIFIIGRYRGELLQIIRPR